MSRDDGVRDRRAHVTSGLDSALLEVRVLPWRPRTRALEPARVRELASDGDPFLGVDDITGVAITLAVWLAIVVAAPLVVLVLAAALLSVELPVVVALAVLLLLARFTGVIPWTVVVVDRVTGAERREHHRSLVRAVRRIRAVNADRRVVVRWAWA